MKDIKFLPMTSESVYLYSVPTPSSTSIPAWYRQMPTRINNEKTLRLVTASNEVNGTLKMCVPFLDSLLTGYTIVLSHDVLIEKDPKNPGTSEVFWKNGGSDFVTTHHSDQSKYFPIPDKYCNVVYKWTNMWGIQTPPGYSCWFTHPLNRVDLPFFTFTGVVDTDKYFLPVLFPFLLDKDFEGVIERGTPIVQIFPFKRESWESKTLPYDELKMELERNRLRGLLERAYKRLYWSKKSFK